MNQTNNRKALGKGLEQLFTGGQMDFSSFEKEIVAKTPENEIVNIPVSEIRSNPYQPRTHFDEESLKELSESIKQYGILEPIIVKKSIKGYELVAGERRTKATRLAGIETIPAIIKNFDDEEMMEIAILENIQREDLSPTEEAIAYKNLMNQTGLTQEEVARRFGKSRSYITNILGLLTLPETVQKMIENKEISMSHARVLSKMEDKEEVLNLASKIITDNISVRELENISREENIVKKKPIQKRVNIQTSKQKIYESTLKDLIGNKVSVSSGKIIIPFDSENDLDRIMDLLNIEVGE